MNDGVRSWTIGAALTALLTLSAWPCLAVDQVPVADTLTRLSTQAGFEVVGLEHAKDAYGRDEGGATYPRLRALLEAFNHVILQTPDGGIDRVILLGRKTAWVAPPPPEGKTPAEGAPGQPPAEAAGDLVIPTERRGTAHMVNASLEGEGGKRASVSLAVDTGADSVVLPASLIPTLALKPQALQQREVQTANGKTTARVGRLAGVWFGDRKIADVQVSFIDDAKLGGNALLGMSVLGRYRMSIDDEANQLTLSPK
jgi:aspartyl protease family protein